MNLSNTKDLEGWLKRSRGKIPLAIILGGSANGLSFARSLGRRVVPTLLLDNEGWDIQAYLALRKSGRLNLWRWLKSLRRAKVTIAAWDDPFPLIVGFWRLLRLRLNDALTRASIS